MLSCAISWAKRDGPVGKPSGVFQLISGKLKSPTRSFRAKERPETEATIEVNLLTFSLFGDGGL